MRTLIIYLIGLLILCSSCGVDPKVEDQPSLFSTEETPSIIKLNQLEEIKRRGTLKAVTTYSSTGYFLYKGRTMGFEYELLENFADYLGVKLEIIVEEDIDKLFDHLYNGSADIVAHGLTITNERKQEVLFSEYLHLVKQVLVQKKPDNWRKLRTHEINQALVEDVVDLIGDTVSVRESSAYMARLKNLSDEIGGNIIVNTLKGTESTEMALEKVLKGEIKYTIADDNIAKVYATYYPELDINVPVSFSQRIAWAMKNSSESLRTEVNQWLKSIKNQPYYNVVYNKYFKNTKSYKKRIKSDFFSLKSNKISIYDKVIQEEAGKAGWDWRLVASLVYQESQFDPNANSWVGAKGLMQMMPGTAEELGVKDRLDPHDNLKGGVKYLHQLSEYFNFIPDSVQRKKFVLASYNCGFGHVYDAQALAKVRGVNPNVWDDAVENVLLDLSKPSAYNNPAVKYGYVRGEEPYNYVRQIFERYELYKSFIN